MRVLVTGAGGFVGGHVADAEADQGHEVIRLDAYLPQAHGPRPVDDQGVLRIDVGDPRAIRDVVEGVDVVCHHAAMVGAGVTVADLPDFARHNDLATAVLLAAMANAGVGRLVLASSMVVYGDGRYTCPVHADQIPEQRSIVDLERATFDPVCPQCGRALHWQPVDEDAALVPRSGYAASKVAQEHYAAAWARQTGGRVIALRYHNVYGPRMPQDTPYSGVAALFRSALERGAPPRVFEDGRQMRDFVHVSDVARANVVAIDTVGRAEAGELRPYNVCSGRPISIGDVASTISAAVGGPAPVTTGEFRAGDVRHIVASPDRAAEELGFRAIVDPDDGLRAFATAPLRKR